MNSEQVNKMLNSLKEQGISLKVMLENLDPNKQEEIDFIKVVASHLISDIDSSLKQIK